MQENRIESIKDTLREQAGVIKEKAADAKDAIARNGSRAIDNVGGFIKEHPIAAVGVAFGIGYIAVRLLRR